MPSKIFNAFIIISVLSTTFTNYVSTSSREDEINAERYNKGKEKYEAIKRETMMPKYSKCWKTALQKLEVGCKHLNDDIQHRLALEFSNCFLQKTGRETYPCSPTQDIEDCTGNMKPEAFNTYTEFFTHTQNICFFLQSQIWQEITENTIFKLSDNSENVAKQLEDSGQLQNEIIKRQNESIRNQEILLERGRELSHTIETSSVDIHHMLKEYKDATSEQRAMIFEVFDRLNSLQSVVMGEFTGFYSFIFYTLSVLVSYLLTSSQRTSGARFWLFAVMTLNVVLERLVVAWGVEEDTISSPFTDASAAIYGRLRWCRQVSCGVAVLILAIFAYRYRDLNAINNQLLVEIRKQNSDLKKMILTAQNVSSTVSQMADASDLLQIGDKSQLPISPHMFPSQSSCNENENRRVSSISCDSAVDLHESAESESDDSSSDEDCHSDHTFILEDHESECSDSDVDTSVLNGSVRQSREGTPAMIDELRVLRASTPFRQMTPVKEIAQSVLSVLGELTTASPSGRGRPKGSKNKTPSPPTPPQYLHPCRYNLRNRRSGVVSANPVIVEETPEAFAKTVRNLSRIAQRNSVKTRMTIEKINSGNFYSLDEN